MEKNLISGSTMSLLSVIIVNYYSASDLLLDCINSLYEFEKNKKLFEIIIVNNGENEQNINDFKVRFPEIQWLEMDYNAGFSRANNCGIKCSKGDYILLLNADTVFIEPIFESLLSKMNTGRSLSACGVQLLNPDRTLQSSGAKFVKGGLNHLLPLPYLGIFFRWCAYKLGQQNPNQTQLKAIVEVDWISGAFLMVRKAAIKQVGMMDEDFFMYAEEVEWCSRLAKFGNLILFGEQKIIHIGGGTTSHISESKINNYQTVSDKKGGQTIVSNLLRVRKQYGFFWFFLLLFVYSAELFIYPVALIIENCTQLRPIFSDFDRIKGFWKNIICLYRLVPQMILNRHFFYKVI